MEVLTTDTETASFAELLDQYEYPQPVQGDILEGRLLRVEDDILYVDVGAKRDAVVPHEEVSELKEELLQSLSNGDTIPVYVTRTPVGDEQLIVSLRKGLAQRDWERAEQVMERDETVECEVVGHNKGGLLVQFGRVQGFVPNSHESELRRMNDRRQETSYKARLVGEMLPLKVIEIDRERERLVLSATAARRDLRDEQLEELQVGQVVTGRVVNIVDFGAFMDLGYVTGLLHVSKMAWDKVDHPADVLSVGDEVEVLIDSIDPDRERVSLNRQALLPSPWQQFAQGHEEGELIEGVVTAIVDYGAFILVAPGIEGLLHVSEIEGFVENVEGVLQVGDTVLTRIISIDVERERLSLSMSRVSEQEQVEWMMGQRQAEAQPEPAEEPTAEAEAEPMVDVGPEPEAEAEAEAVADAGPEPEAEAEAEPMAKTRPEAEAEAEPVADVEPEAEAETEPEPAEAEVEAGAEEEPEPEAEPELEAEAMAVG